MKFFTKYRFDGAYERRAIFIVVALVFLMAYASCTIIEFPDIPYAAAKVTVTNIDPATKHVRVGTNDKMAENITGEDNKCFPLFADHNGEPERDFTFPLLKSGNHTFRAETYSDTAGTQRLQYVKVKVDLEKEETLELEMVMESAPQNHAGEFFTECTSVITGMDPSDIEDLLGDVEIPADISGSTQ